MEEEARREDFALEVRRRRGQQEDDLSGEEDGEERVGGGEGEDVRLEVLVVLEGEDGRLRRERVVADEQRAVELDRVALRDVYGRGGKARSGKFQYKGGTLNLLFPEKHVIARSRKKNGCPGMLNQKEYFLVSMLQMTE